MDDSEADLYAEYHGGTVSRSSSESSLLEGDLGIPGSSGDGLRIRKGSKTTLMKDQNFLSKLIENQSLSLIMTFFRLICA